MRRRLKIVLDIGLILIGLLDILVAWIILGLGIEAILIRFSLDLHLGNTEAWRSAFSSSCYGFYSYRGIVAIIGVTVLVIGICSLVVDLGEPVSKDNGK